jgi:hypothetical protein
MKKKTPARKVKDYSGTIKELLGEPNTCGGCHYSTSTKGGKEWWYCDRYQGPTSRNDSCTDYQEYAGNRRK